MVDKLEPEEVKAWLAHPVTLRFLTNLEILKRARLQEEHLSRDPTQGLMAKGRVDEVQYIHDNIEIITLGGDE